VGGIIVNRVRSTADEHEYRLHELGEIYGKPTLFRPYIPERMVVQQAESTGQPVQLMRGVAAEELTDIYARYLRRLLRAVPVEEVDEEEA
jgi:cellulose biosynthesis protein BcsQ